MLKSLFIATLFVCATSVAAEPPLKNIQVLKGATHDDIDLAMKVMAGALGVDCEHCHVRGMEKDDKEAKRTARKMITMTDALNRDFFGGQKVVGCVTCHQGHVEPRALPNLDTAFHAPEAESEAKPPTVTVKDVLDKWLAATGGKAAWEKLRTRSAKGTLAWGAPDQKIPVEVTIAAPDHYLVQATTPRGPLWQGFDGKEAWAKGGFGVAVMSPWDAADLARDGRLRAPLELASVVTGLRALPDETIGGKPAHVLVGRANGCSEKLFFDAASALLVRRVVTMPTRVGDLAEQIDYDDFKTVDGVKVPFTVRRNSNGEVQIESYEAVKFNVPVDSKLFARPAK